MKIIVKIFIGLVAYTIFASIYNQNASKQSAQNFNEADILDPGGLTDNNMIMPVVRADYETVNPLPNPIVNTFGLLGFANYGG